MNTKNIVIIGLGKMGSNLATNLHEQEWSIWGYDPFQKDALPGVQMMSSFTEIADVQPRAIILAVPALAVREILESLLPHVSHGTVVIDMGNSHYTDTVENAAYCESLHIAFLDCGVSGGPAGARSGATCMVGGAKDVYDSVEDIFSDIARAAGAYAWVGKSGAGHYLKMIHNQIEYGMIQAIAEGAYLLAEGPYEISLPDAFRILSKGTIIESRLVSLGSEILSSTPDFSRIAPRVDASGEAAWALELAHQIGISLPVTEAALDARRSVDPTSAFIRKFIALLRNAFGGHHIYHDDESK